MGLLGAIEHLGKAALHVAEPLAEIAATAAAGPLAGMVVAGGINELNKSIEGASPAPSPQHKHQWEDALSTAAKTLVGHLGEV